jgi:putative PIG3 family NAD(P)H quinone oxidoreductase
MPVIPGEVEASRGSCLKVPHRDDVNELPLTRRPSENRFSSMRAVVINSFGGVEGLEFREVEDLPPPTADRVRVRVKAAGLNRADLLQRKGHYPAPPGYPTNIPGLEFAGEVESLGETARAWKIGDRVFGITAGGAQAEFVTAPESHLARIPERLDFIAAGGMPEVFITAHDALFTRAHLQMGERLLVHAAASGVGTAAVQLAHAAGAIVFGTSRTAEKLREIRDLGLNEAIPVGNSPAGFVEAVARLTNGGGVDVVLDLVGGSYFAANLKAIAPLGRIVCVGTVAGSQSEVDLGRILRRRVTIIGTVLRGRSVAEKATATRAFADHVLPLVERGAVRPVIARSFPAAEVGAAHEYLESNRATGKIVLDFSA